MSVSPKEQFLSRRQRDQPISLLDKFSDEEMTRDWTLSDKDKEEIGKYRKVFRLSIAIQICAVRLYGRFLNQVRDLSASSNDLIVAILPEALPNCGCDRY